MKGLTALLKKSGGEKMQAKEVLVVLTDRWADWEAAFAIAEVNSVPQYAVKTIARDTSSKVSIGGIRAEIDYRLDEYRNFDNLAMVILPGGFSWQEERHDDVANLVRSALKERVPVAAICGATIFLGEHGFLDHVKHTGDTLAAFRDKSGYAGENNYQPTQVVADGGFITATETAAMEFAREIFKTLEIDDSAAIEQWYDEFKHGAIRD